MADADDQDELFMGPSAGSSSTAVAGAAGQTDYRYLQEIAQMVSDRLAEQSVVAFEQALIVVHRELVLPCRCSFSAESSTHQKLS